MNYINPYKISLNNLIFQKNKINNLTINLWSLILLTNLFLSWLGNTLYYFDFTNII